MKCIKKSIKEKATQISSSVELAGTFVSFAFQSQSKKTGLSLSILKWIHPHFVMQCNELHFFSIEYSYHNHKFLPKFITITVHLMLMLCFRKISTFQSDKNQNVGFCCFYTLLTMFMLQYSKWSKKKNPQMIFSRYIYRWGLIL